MNYIRKETAISQQAKEWIKKHKKELLATFASDEICPSFVDIQDEKPSTILMAGSPGAGKTEFSRNLIKKNKLVVVRIDPDDVRKILPQYTGKNSDEVQGAASLGVEKLYDYVLQKKKPVIIDGTLTNFDLSYKNIKRSLDKGRRVAIFYIYQDPLIAWNFTQIREKVEGRYIPKWAFIDAFLNAKKNVEKMKKEFGNKIDVYVVKKNFNNDLSEIYEMDGSSHSSIDEMLDFKYSKTTLDKLI